MAGVAGVFPADMISWLSLSYRPKRIVLGWMGLSESWSPVEQWLSPGKSNTEIRSERSVQILYMNFKTTVPMEGPSVYDFLRATAVIIR